MRMIASKKTQNPVQVSTRSRRLCFLSEADCKQGCFVVQAGGDFWAARAMKEVFDIYQALQQTSVPMALMCLRLARALQKGLNARLRGGSDDVQLRHLLL